jgi:hypothetical protein
VQLGGQVYQVDDAHSFASGVRHDVWREEMLVFRDEVAHPA